MLVLVINIVYKSLLPNVLGFLYYDNLIKNNSVFIFIIYK